MYTKMQRQYALKLFVIMQAYSSIAKNIYKHCIFHHIIFQLSFFLMSNK